MHDLPRQKLKLIITRYGIFLHDNPKRCEALLRDFCGQYRKEINLLIHAQKEKIPSELLTSQNSSLPISLTIARLSKRLEDNLAITSEAAKWSVESWALALNVITEAETIEEKPASSDRVPSVSDNKTKARSLSPPPSVKPPYRRETIQQHQISSDTENGALSSPKRQRGIFSSTKIRRSVLLISTVLGLNWMFSDYLGLGYLLAGYSLIMISGACVVFFGRPKSVALWRRIIMWVVGSYTGIGGVVGFLIALEEGLQDIYPPGVRALAIVYILSIFIGRW